MKPSSATDGEIIASIVGSIAGTSHQLNRVCVELPRSEWDTVMYALSARSESAEFPPMVRTAIAILLRHVEPGWDNCTTLVQAWLDGKLDTSRSATAELKAVGLFWQTGDGKWHFSPGSTDRGDIHDNGRPIRIAYLGEEAK